MSDLVIRMDRASLLASPRVQSDGSVIYTGRVARTGDHPYPWGVERRDESELRSIVNQLPGTPVLASHPANGGVLMRGAYGRKVGTVLSARVDGIHAVAELHLDPAGVALVRAGYEELSLGYLTKAVRGNQTNTRVDHTALVLAGRCGPSCSIRVDCGGDECGCGCQPSPEMRVMFQAGALRLRSKQ